VTLANVPARYLQHGDRVTTEEGVIVADTVIDTGGHVEVTEPNGTVWRLPADMIVTRNRPKRGVES